MAIHYIFPIYETLFYSFFTFFLILDIEAKLYECKTKLAANITRLRVQNNALHLSQMLPVHLQDAKVAIAVSYPIISGWINRFKVK